MWQQSDNRWQECHVNQNKPLQGAGKKKKFTPASCRLLVALSVCNRKQARCSGLLFIISRWRWIEKDKQIWKPRCRINICVLNSYAQSFGSALETPGRNPQRLPGVNKHNTTRHSRQCGPAFTLPFLEDYMWGDLLLLYWGWRFERKHTFLTDSHTQKW